MLQVRGCITWSFFTPTTICPCLIWACCQLRPTIQAYDNLALFAMFYTFVHSSQVLNCYLRQGRVLHSVAQWNLHSHCNRHLNMTLISKQRDTIQNSSLHVFVWMHFRYFVVHTYCAMSRDLNLNFKFSNTWRNINLNHKMLQVKRSHDISAHPQSWPHLGVRHAQAYKSGMIKVKPYCCARCLCRHQSCA